MTRIASSLIAIPAVVLAVFGGRAISAQDKYTVEVPGGLAFSEFRGYEDWSVVAMSENGGVFAVILGNPVAIAAFREGVPGNGKPFPDGAKIAKVHWHPKKQEAYPGPPMVPGTHLNSHFMEKDSKRFADSGGWGWAAFEYDAASDTFRPRNRVGISAAGTRRQVRARVPHDSAEPRLRFHGVRAPVKR